MMRNILTLCLSVTFLACTPPPNYAPGGGDGDGDTIPTSQYDAGTLIFTTNLGWFAVQLYSDLAPITTDNFMRYVEAGFYDGKDGKGSTIFHRSVEDFMIQGGGITEDGTEKNTYAPISNESTSNGLSNIMGTLAMARTNDPDSATAQFFINTVDNVYLDAGEIYEVGYAVFGEVIDNYQVIEAMTEIEVDDNDKPTSNIVIEDIYVVP